jgi:copper(I)-binding protein
MALACAKPTRRAPLAPHSQTLTHPFMKKFIPGLVATFLFAAGAQAQVAVSDAWIRATVPQQSSSGAFMQLRAAKATRLVAVSSPVAGTVEIHEMAMQGQTMRMHAVDGIDLPAGKEVSLSSGGYHVMLLDLKRQLKEGERIDLTLTTQDRSNKRSSVTVQVPVKALAYVNPQPGLPVQR